MPITYGVAVTDRARPQTVGFWEVLAFGCELAMLISLAVAGWLGVDALVPRIALAIALPGLVVAVWAVWMAPTSPRRLANPWRLLVQTALFALTGAALGAVGHPGWGVTVAAVSIIDIGVLAVRERSA